MQDIKNRKWLAALAFILLYPLSIQAVEWKGNNWNAHLNGALRASYNVDEKYDQETDSQKDNKYLSGNVSHVQLTGSRTLKMGISGIFKTEWGLDPTDNGGEDRLSLYDMDQYLGLEGGFGLLRVGTMLTPYMQTGIMMDPYRRDALAARFFPEIQSALHEGTGKGRGRTTNSIRIDSPPARGVAAQFFYGIDQSENNDDSIGTGLTFDSEYMSLFAQWYDNGEPGKDKAWKLGGELKGGGASLFGQYEYDDGLISIAEGISGRTSPDEKNNTYGADVWHAGLKYTNGKMLLIGQYGQRKDSKNGAAEKDGLTGWLLGLSIYLDKSFYFYTGYAQKDFNDNRKSDSRITLGGTLTF